MGGSDSYFSINERWYMCEQFLQAVFDDLSENLDRIEDWKRRKKKIENRRDLVGPEMTGRRTVPQLLNSKY
jgi:hypothetical protein